MLCKHEVIGSNPFTSTKIATTIEGGVAQLGEHVLRKHGVVGSSPITSTKVAVDLNRFEKRDLFRSDAVRNDECQSSKTK